MTRKTLLCLILITMLTFSVYSQKSNNKIVIIATGKVSGVDYPAGGAISGIINKKSQLYGFRTYVEVTGGPVYNINAVLSRKLDFAIVQSDWQYYAYDGLKNANTPDEWQNNGALKNLRSVFSLHDKLITLAATVKSGIHTIEDLKGKRINLGYHGSYQHQSALYVLNAAGLSEKDIQPFNKKVDESLRDLENDDLDAIFITTAHPSLKLLTAVSGREQLRLIPIENQISQKLLKLQPFLTHGIIPIKAYPGLANKKDVPALGFKASLVTHKDMDDHIVYAITKEIFENFDSLKLSHPAYSTLKKETLLRALTAPIHRGALRYYRETGLIKEIDPKLVLANDDVGPKKLNIKAAIEAGLSHPNSQGLMKMAELLKQWTKGRISFQLNHSSRSEPNTAIDLVNQTRLGSTDLILVQSNRLIHLVKEMKILTLPYIFKDENHYWQVLDSKIGQLLLKKLYFHNLVGLCYYEGGQRSFYNSKRRTRKPQRFRRLKLRIDNDQLMIDTVKALGAKPIILPNEQVYGAIKSGRIDGAEGNITDYISKRHYEGAKYYCYDEHSRTTYVLLFSKKIWISLNKNDRLLIKKAARESIAHQRKLWRNKVKTAKISAINSGCKFSKINNKKAFIKAMRKVYLKHAQGLFSWIKAIQLIHGS